VLTCVLIIRLTGTHVFKCKLITVYQIFVWNTCVQRFKTRLVSWNLQNTCVHMWIEYCVRSSHLNTCDLMLNTCGDLCKIVEIYVFTLTHMWNTCVHMWIIYWVRNIHLNTCVDMLNTCGVFCETVELHVLTCAHMWNTCIHMLNTCEHMWTRVIFFVRV
jgi:hypothetical protein